MTKHDRTTRLAMTVLAGGVSALLATACQRGDSAPTDSTAAAAQPPESGATSSAPRPDQYPAVSNKEMPFKYPPALYADKKQGDVTLRLYVDTSGTVVDDSTRIAQSSSVPLLDSAALKGAHELHFTPARLHGAPMAVTILFPVYFRHPEATPPAGDSALAKLKSDLMKATQPADSSKSSGSKSGSTTKKSSSRRKHRS